MEPDQPASEMAMVIYTGRKSAPGPARLSRNRHDSGSVGTSNNSTQTWPYPPRRPPHFISRDDIFGTPKRNIRRPTKHQETQLALTITLPTPSTSTTSPPMIFEGGRSGEVSIRGTASGEDSTKVTKRKELEPFATNRAKRHKKDDTGERRLGHMIYLKKRIKDVQDEVLHLTQSNKGYLEDLRQTEVRYRFCTLALRHLVKSDGTRAN